MQVSTNWNTEASCVKFGVRKSAHQEMLLTLGTHRASKWLHLVSGAWYIKLYFNTSKRNAPTLPTNIFGHNWPEKERGGLYKRENSTDVSGYSICNGFLKSIDLNSTEESPILGVGA